MARKKMAKGKWPPTDVMAGGNKSKDGVGKKKTPFQLKGKGKSSQAKKTNVAKAAKGYNFAS
jgi:hypothetical protein